MTRTAAIKSYANFTQGFVTEANQLSFPENAAIDLDNVNINEDGSVQRRAGLAFDGTLTKTIDTGANSISNTATASFKWRAVNGDPDKNIAVVQAADRLDFFYIRDEEIISNTPAAASITLTAPTRASASTTTLRKRNKISVASGGGRLYVVGKYIDPFVLEFNEPVTEWDTGTLTQTSLVLKIRDFEVVEEGETFTSPSYPSIEYSLDGKERQLFMSGAHFYNLANQGYPYQTDASGFISEADAVCSSASNPDSGTLDEEPAFHTANRVNFYPTTQDLFHTYQAGGGQTIEEQIAYSPWLLKNDYTGTSLSPRGRLIKEAFFIERKAVTVNHFTGVPEIADIPASYLTYDETTTSDFRPSSVAFYAGRVWYSGLEGTKFTNNVYFSQVIGDDVKKAAKCYQDADPTAESINELVATDGGVLGLEEVGKVLALYPIGPSLVVVADNGVWVISGDGEASSFRADSFSVRKVTDQGAINKDSVVFAKDTVYYMANTAIIAILTGETGGVVGQDVSSNRIKGFYQNISNNIRSNVYSVFDEGSNRIFWAYSDDIPDTIPSDLTSKAYNKALYWDLSLGAFGKFSFAIDATTVPVGSFSANVFNSLDIVDTVVDGGVTVTDGGLDVTVTDTVFISERSSVKVMTLTGSVGSGYTYRFSDFRNVDEYTDWDNNYVSFVESGFDSLQDVVSKGKKAGILQLHFERTEDGYELDQQQEIQITNPSGCLVSYGWDWETSPYSNQFQGYKLLRNYTPESVLDPFNYDTTVITTRNRIRGRGTSLGLRFESEDAKDFKLLGYGIVYSNRGRP